MFETQNKSRNRKTIQIRVTVGRRMNELTEDDTVCVAVDVKNMINVFIVRVPLLLLCFKINFNVCLVLLLVAQIKGK